MGTKKRDGKNEKMLGDHVEDLPVPITDEDRLRHGARLAQIDLEIATHYQHEDEIKKQLKATETRLEAERMVLSNIIRNGKEPRPVKVEAWAYFSEGIYEEVRCDTGEPLAGRARPLTTEERQDGLLPKDAGAMLSPAAAKAAAEQLVEKKSQKRAAKKDAKDKADEAR